MYTNLTTPPPLGVLKANKNKLETNNVKEHNVFKNPNWQAVDWLPWYKVQQRSWTTLLGRSLNPGPLDYKSFTLTTLPQCHHHSERSTEQNYSWLRHKTIWQPGQFNTLNSSPSLKTATNWNNHNTKSITCWVLISTPESQQPKPGWEWYQPTTISGLKKYNDI